MSDHELSQTAFRDSALRQDLNSPALQLLRRRAKETAEDAMNELVEADPNDTFRIMRLQNEVKRLGDIEMWILEELQQLSDPDVEPYSE